MSKAQKRATREAFNKFLSLLLAMAMILQTSPFAYANAGVNNDTTDVVAEPVTLEAQSSEEEPGEEPAAPTDPAAVEPAPSEDPVDPVEPEVTTTDDPEVTPTDDPVVDPVDEPADDPVVVDDTTTEPAEGEGTTTEPADPAEPAEPEEPEEQEKATISVHVENATVTIGEQKLTSDGTVEVPAGEELSFSVKAADGYELEDGSVKVTVDGSETTLSGSYKLAADQVKDGTAISVAAKKTDTKTVYKYEDGNVRVTATLDKGSAIPDDAWLSVTPVTKDSPEYNYDAYMGALNDSVEGEGVYDDQNTLLYDVAFLYVDEDGNTVELQPEEGYVTVEFAFKRQQLSEDISAGSAANVEVNHLPLADWAKADTTAESTAISADDVRVEALDASATGTDAVEVRTDSFSVYAFSYTVDFTYDGYTYSIAGESEVLLSALLEQLGIDVDVADVASVTFSDPELVAVEQVEGDWKLTSLKAFSTEETLTIELANGDRYIITVTDDQEPITLNPYISSRVIQYRVSPTSPWIDYTPGTELDNGWELKVSVDYTLPTGTLSSDNRVVTYEIPVTGFDVEEVHDFEIKNSDNVTIGHMDIVDGLVTLTFTSDFASTGQAITGSFSFVGVADFTYGEEPYQINFGGDGGTVIIRRESVEEKDLSIGKTHGTITLEDDGDYTWNYTVTVSSTKGTGGQPVDVSDTVTLSSASFPYTHGTPTVTLVKADASTEVIDSNQYTYASSGTDWTITGLPALAAGEKYTITYSATIDAPQPSGDSNGITQNVNNTASATYGATPVSTTHKIQLKPENVKKNTTNNNVANTSTWEITINPNCHDITGWTFTDTMFGDMSLFSDVVITSQNATSHKVTLKIADLIAADPDGDGKVTSFSYTFNSGGVFTAKDLRNPFKITYRTSGTGYNTSSFAHASLSYTDTQSGGVVPGPGTWNKKAVLTPLLDTDNKRIKFTWYSSQYGLTGTITEGTTSSISDDLIQPVYELPNGEEVAPLHYMYLGPTGPNGEKGIQYVFEDNLKLSTADGARYRFHSGSPTNCQYSASGADTGWVDTTDVELELKGYILNEDGVTYTEVTDGQTPITRWTLFIKAKNHDFNLNSIFLSNERYYESFVDYSGYEPYVREINSIVENGLKVGDDTGYVQTVAQQYVSSQYLEKKMTGTKYIEATGGWYVRYQVDFPVDLYETYGADLVLKDQRSSAQGPGYGQFISGRTSSSPEYQYRPLAYTSVSKTSGNSYSLTRNTHWKYQNLNDETGYVEFNVYNLPAQATDNEKNIRIIYWVRYDTDPFWADPLHNEKTYDNEITDNLDLGLHDNATYTYKKQSSILEKTGHQMVDEGGNLTNYVGFYVYLNHPTPVDVDPTSDMLTLTDTFSETTATFEEDSLKVYDYDPDNAPTYVGNEVTEGWTHTFDSATNTLTMTLPDERALVVEYVYNLNTVPSTVTSIQNNALLNGTYPRVISKEFDYNDISAEANQRKIEIIKAEAGNYNIKLDGVKFLFQKYTTDGWEDIGTYTTDGNGEINFDIIDMNLEENVLYCMTETQPKGGYLNGDGESELKFYFAITAEHATAEDTLAVLTQNGHHPDNFMPTEANTTIYPYKGGQMFLENVKIIPVTAQIPVKKVLSGREWKNSDTFTFTLTRSTTNAPLPPTAGRTVTITKDTPNYTDKFGVITFTEPGTYVYKVKETKGTIAGITYSTVTKQVTIKVEMGENGHLVITSPSSGTIATQSFTNTYKATGSATFSAKKTGENLGDRTFQFELLNENDEVIQTSDPVKQGETWTFTQINYDKKVDLGGQNSKTFTYKIREKLPEGVTAQNPTKDGVTYDTHVETVTVVVTDDTNGHLVVTYNGNTSFTTPEFENSYSATGTAPLEAKKAITGADWPSGAKATFTVTANDGGPLPETTSVVLTAPDTANFGNITFSLADAGKTYKYTIDETPEGFGQGWTRSTSITATVVVGDDDGDGTLECTVSYSPSHKTITNAYTASGSATLSAMKAASTTLGDRTFQFELLDANDRVIETSAAVKQNETATFTTITYELEDLGGQPFKTYTYKIREKLPEGVSAQNPTKDGVTYDTRIVTTVVKVTNNGAGQLVVTYDGNETFTTPVFENKYEAEGSATLNAKKAANANLADRTFQFQLLDEQGNVLETSAAVKQGETATFTTINYTLADLGGETSKEFTYKIREVLPEGVTEQNPTKDGVTYDTTVKTTVVKVTDLGNGTLKVEYDGNESFSTPEFSNSYAAEGSATLSAKKAANPNLKTKTFQFELLDAEGNLIETSAAVKQGETATFTTINYTLADLGGADSKAFTYKIREVLPEGVTEQNPTKDGVTYDTHVQETTVTVTNDGSGNLTVKYDGNESFITPLFQNDYEAEGSATFSAKKAANSNLADKTFQFQLLDEQGNVLETSAAVKQNENVTFTSIEYDLDDLGGADSKEFTYKIREVLPEGVDEDNPTKDGVTYDTRVVTTVVKVTDLGNGTLKVEYDGNESFTTPEFSNSYAAEGSATFDAKKAANANLKTKTFQFELLDAEGNLIETSAAVKQNETATFTSIKYELADLGGADSKDFTYKIREKLPEGVTEQNPTKDGVTYDTHVQETTVTVTNNGDGNLSVKYDGNESFTTPVFQNDYEAEGSATFSAKKAANSNLADKTFQFQLLDADGQVIETSAPVKQNETATFKSIKYELADLGGEESKDFTYKIREKLPEGVTAENPTKDGVTYDTHVETIVVTVSDLGNGELGVLYDGNEGFTTPEFSNSYAAEGSATLSAKKAANPNLKTKTFQFELLDADGNLIETSAAVKQNETATFASIKYELADLGGADSKDFTYTIREKLPEGVTAANPKKDGVTYDTHEQAVTVTVTNDGSGNLVVTYDGNESFSTPVFENDYEAEGSATMSAKKAANANLADRTFQFQLLDADGQVIETSAAVKQNQSATFTTIKYELADLKGADSKDFTYKIREKLPEGVTAENPTKDGVTYDTRVVTTVVTVTDNGDGTLSVTYDGNESFSTPVFENAYAAEGSATLSAKKAASDTLENRTFQFELLDADGNLIETSAAVKQNETATFTSIKYDLADLEGADSKEYTYQIREKLPEGVTAENPTKDGVTYDTHVVTTVVKVTNDGVGHLTVTYDGNENFTTPEFENSYATKGEGEVKVKKNLTGRPWKDGDTFTFTIAADGSNPDANAKPAKTEVTITKDTADYTDTFGTITFTKPGTYKYVVKETKGAITGVTYDESEHTVTIVAVDDGKGHIVAEPDKSLIQTAEVTNEYTPDKPTFDKKVQDVNDSTGETSGWQDSADYDVNDDVPFRLSAKLPTDVTSYKKYRLTFTDSMEASLDFNGIDKVTVDGKTVTNWSVSATEHAFELTLTWEATDGATISDESLNGATVEVFFSAQLNDGAKRGIEGNVNACKLTYSDKPTVESSTESLPWDYVIVFTYDLVVSKVDQNGEPLTGATFKLEKKLSGGSRKLIAEVPGDQSSTFTFKGLDDGDYVLTETAVPRHHKFISPNPIEFTVTADHEVAWDVTSNELDFDQPGRSAVLTALTGNVTTGELELVANKSMTALTGTIENEEAKRPESEKKIKDTNDTTGEKSDWQDSADYDIGDAVPFQLTATLADNVTDYFRYHITFTDQMEEGLTFDEVTSVTVNGEEVDPADYELTANDHDFELTLRWAGDGGRRITDAALNEAAVVVEFTATLNEDAKLGNEGNVNACKLSYSTNPNTDQDKDEEELPWDYVVAFTYGVTVNKVDPEGEPLAGAEFKLEKKLADGSLELIERLTVTDETTFTFTGLDDGDYVLTETKTPKGYKLIDPVEFTVTAEHAVEWDVTSDELDFDQPGRTDVLTSLTGEVTTGELALEADEALSTLVGDVVNEPHEKPEDDKTVKDTNDSTGETSDWQDSADYDIGDAVPFRLRALLPGDVTNYRHYHITFTDQMEPGLTFNGIDSVTVNGAEVTDYILDQTDDQNFKLTLNWGEGEDAAITEDLDNAEVCVYFTATLNDAAVLGSEGNVNACQLSYSNNSTSDTEEDEEKLPWDYVIAFTYGVTINKVDQDGKALEGCEFKLEKKLADGSFELIDRLTVTDGTVFSFTGLDDGDYVLTETAAPKNYRAADPIEFTVTADHGAWDVKSDDLDFAQPGRTEVLGGLTGDVKTGELKLAADDALSTLTGEVENPYVPDSVEIPVKKLWTRGGQEVAWPSGARVTVALLADGEQVAEHVLTADASSFTFTGMPKTNYNGTKEIAYTVKETSVTGVTDKYNTTIAGNAKEGFVIKNAFGRLPQTSDLIDSMVIRVLGAAGSILVGAGSVLAVSRYLKRREDEE